MSSLCDFDDDFVAHSMNIDDAYRVEKLLARGQGGVTELVSLDGAGPFVRKKIPAKTARREVWSILPECACFRLPLARGQGGVTELVSLDGAGPFVRKKIPAKTARREVWSILPECACFRLPRLLATGGVTELVSLDGAGPFVRKKIPAKTARREVWSILPECACFRLPRLLATYETPDWYAVVYEYVPGSTLEELVECGGGFDSLGAVRMILDVCEAVLALHAKGVIHRDLAPKNILIAADGVHVIDLGIARCCIDPPSRATAALGTHGFAAPEQYGFADTDVRSDVYSLGCLLGYAITGLPPGEPGAAEAMADRRRVPERLRLWLIGAGFRKPSLPL